MRPANAGECRYERVDGGEDGYEGEEEEGNPVPSFP